MKRLNIFYFALMCVLMFPAGRANCVFAGIDTTDFVASPILSRPTDKSVTISIVPKKVLSIYVECGTSSMNYSLFTAAQNSQANVPMRFVLSGLNKNTKYYYRIAYKDTSAAAFSYTEENNFMTQRKAGSPFRFAITTDSHLYDKKGVPAMMNLTLENIQNDSPDILFDLGDTFGDDHDSVNITQQQMMQLHLNLIPYFGQNCKSEHFFFCLGNHEGENGNCLLINPPNNMSTYATLARKYYYANPVPDGFYSGNTDVEDFGMGLPENYYAFEWGDALFVILDVYRSYTANQKPNGWDWTLGEKQYYWFKQTLESSHAKFKFVFAHHVSGQGRGAVKLAKSFEWGGYEANGTTWGFTNKRPGWAAPIHQLMVQNGVNVFFQGHDHLFAQETLDGVIYQECPMPSDSSYTIGMLANADAYLSNQINGTGYILVSVGSDSSQIDYVRSYLPKDTSAVQVNKSSAFSYTVTPKVSDVQTEYKNSKSMQLMQNYPNPFNPSTDIMYVISESGHVTLKIIDILGREVATLVDEYKQPGVYTSKLNMQNLTSGTVSSGIYIYQLKENSNLITKKLILMK